jgi:Flp pilus assembly secretin CpaC
LVVETEHMSAVTETLDNGEEIRGIRTRRYNTEVEIDSGESLCFDLISSQSCDPDNLVADSETINLKATQTDRGIYIEMRVMSGNAVVATPALIVSVGETAQFLTGSKSGAGLSLKI